MGVHSKASLIRERGLHKEWGFSHDSVSIYWARRLFKAVEVLWHTQQARYITEEGITHRQTLISSPHRFGIPEKKESTEVVVTVWEATLTRQP